MSDRPTPPDDHADDLPDEPAPGPEGASSGNPSAESSPGEDGWAGAVDKPGDDRPGDDKPRADKPGDDHPAAGSTSGPRIGFGSVPGGARDRAGGTGGDAMPDFGAMLQQLLGGGGAGGSGPDLGDLVRRLGGTGGGGQLPDLNELMRRFGGAAGPGGQGGQGGDPMGELLKGMGIDPKDSGLLAMLQGQIAQMFAPQTKESRMTMATEVARKTVAGADADPTITAAQQREVTDAVRVAQLWIDPVTTLDAPSGTGLAWSRAEWVEATMPTWHTLVEPVSTGVTNAITEALKTQMGKLGPEALAESMPQVPGLDLGGLLDQLRPALEQLAGSMFSAQLGHGVGALAADLLSGTEVGLPLLRTEDVALLPTNVAAFTEGLGIEESEVRLYLAVRESARARLFAEVPWLGPQLEAAVRDYARNITIDTDAIEEQLRSVDIQNPTAIQEALQHKLFAPTPTAAQQAALGRLETSLALVEGWVDLVTEQATAPHLPHAGALGEAVRRRRAGGPASKTFSGLVGLELRPRRLKDATNLWAALENAGGKEFRDAPWAHPDIAPTGADLDDPLGYVEQRRASGSSDDLDTALDALLTQEPGQGGPQDGPEDGDSRDDDPRDEPGAAPRG